MITKSLRKWRLNPVNRQKERDWAKRYRLENREKLKLSWRKRHYRRSYGLTLEEVEQIFVKQKEQCAICGKKLPNGFALGKHIDHCHKTNKVRGILCTKCNTLLGMSEDNVIILKKAISYLKR